MNKPTTRAECQTLEDYRNFSEEADYRARCYVNAMRRHSKSDRFEPVGWEFHKRFMVHPWVRQSITEGWGKELRAHLIFVVRKRILEGQPYDNIDELMPPRDWVTYTKARAEGYAQAAAWQEENRHLWETRRGKGDSAKQVFSALRFGNGEGDA